MIKDLDQLVTKWNTVVVGLTMAHDKDEADRFEACVDELLKPLLTAPVKQIREFYPKLLSALKADKQCPFIVWRSLEAWGECMVKSAPDEAVKRLKTKLAAEIDELCEQDVLPQFPEAMVRALQWRDSAQLEEVKEKIKEGGRVKLRGRESCLFMDVYPKGKRKSITTVQL